MEEHFRVIDWPSTLTLSGTTRNTETFSNTDTPKDLWAFIDFVVGLYYRIV